MGLKLLQPPEFFSDSLSFDYINKLLDVLKEEGTILTEYANDDSIQSYHSFYQTINDTFIFHNFSQFGNLERKILRDGVHKELDSYDLLTEEYYQIFIDISKRLSHLLDNSDTS